jgi:hypothetical protein
MALWKISGLDQQGFGFVIKVLRGDIRQKSFPTRLEYQPFFLKRMDRLPFSLGGKGKRCKKKK